MGAINVKHTGSGAAIALSSDGTSLLLDGTAVGGGGSPDLFAENPVSATTPTASGDNAVAIGSGAVASGLQAFAVGSLGIAKASGQHSISMGSYSRASGSTSVGIGYSAEATTTGAVAIGQNSRCSGTYSVSLGKARASGSKSFAAVIDNNTTSYGASGDHSVAMGLLSKSSDHGSVAIGKNCISDGGRTVALGHQTTASEFYSFAVGALSEALQTGSVCTGIRGRSDVQGKRVHSSSTFSAQIGNCQTGELVLGKQTTDATPIQLTSLPGNSASATNSITLPNNSCYGFTGTVIARENSAQTNDFAVWEIKGGAVRAASAATTALGSYNINKISESTGAATWSIALSADTTNGAVAITVTGEASHSIRWVATVNTTEVTY